MAKIICCLTILAVFVVTANALKCYTYTCGSGIGLSCSKNHEIVTCGIPGKGYQSVCSYVAIDEKKGGYVEETACDLVPLGRLEGAELKRCVEPEIEGKVVLCKLCNTDLCNSPPKR